MPRVPNPSTVRTLGLLKTARSHRHPPNCRAACFPFVGDPSAFYVPEGNGVFASTPATAGPWGPESQHGGPPAALLVRAFELTEPQQRSRIARFAMEILRPVPVAPLTIRAAIVRPGRRVALLRGVVEAGGQEVLLAHAWRLQVPEEPAVAVPDAFKVPPIPPPAPMAAWRGAYVDGYMSAIEWRPVAGSLGKPGPGVAWTRARLPLVAGEETSPFARAALVADSGSGVSASVDFSKWHCITSTSPSASTATRRANGCCWTP